MPKTTVNIANESTINADVFSPKVLCVGMKNTLGTAVEGQRYEINGESDLITLFGRDSHISNGIREGLEYNAPRYFLGSEQVKYHAIAFNENSAGTKDSKTITLSGTITTAGTLTISVFSATRFAVSIPIAVGDDLIDVNTAIKAAFDALPNFPFNSTISGTSSEIITFESKVKGGVFKDFNITYSLTSTGLAIAISAATNGATLPLAATIKSKIEEALESFDQRFWYISIENAFINADPTLIDLINSYANNSNYSKKSLLTVVKYDTRSNIASYLAGFNILQYNVVAQSNLTASNSKGSNLISPFHASILINSIYARKNTIGANVSDIGLDIGGIQNIPLSISGLPILGLKIKSEWVKADYEALQDSNCGILFQNENSQWAIIKETDPDHRVTLNLLSNGSEPVYKYFGDIDNQAFFQDYATRLIKASFHKKTISAGTPPQNNSNALDITMAIDKLLIVFQTIATFGVISYSEAIKGQLRTRLQSTVAFNYVNKQISGTVEIEFITEILRVYLNVIPTANN